MPSKQPEVMLDHMHVGFDPTNMQQVEPVPNVNHDDKQLAKDSIKILSAPMNSNNNNNSPSNGCAALFDTTNGSDHSKHELTNHSDVNGKTINTQMNMAAVAADTAATNAEPEGQSDATSASINKAAITNDISQPKTAKPNGLKNRIIQRPPPLILDKVSNFYTTNTEQNGKRLDNTNQQTTNPNDEFNGNSHETHQPTENQPVKNQANHKFWASLHQNASRSKQPTRPNDFAVAEDRFVSRTLDQTITTHSDLGPDLVISVRNNESRSHRELGPPEDKSSSLFNKCDNFDGGDRQVTDQVRSGINSQPENADNVSANYHDLSNNSEFDDSAGNVPSENDGGNLIGIENSTSPTEDPHNTNIDYHEPPVSATSNRSRSNNPFLDSDEELERCFGSVHLQQRSDLSEMQKQVPLDGPYGVNTINGDRQYLDRSRSNVMAPSVALPFTMQGREVVDSGMSGLLTQPNQTNPPNSVPDLNSHFISHPFEQSRPIVQHPQPTSEYGQTQGRVINQPTHNIYGSLQRSNYLSYDAKMSPATENAITKPPPSETMQLPHWTDAIYELNNAIIEASSVAGGAENGEFIYIVESGDIILSLDHVKIPGFTLMDFRELLFSKQVHLLSAIQTKHCIGISVHMRDYLCASFPKGSTEKSLQDTIRENLYKTTIPCTTRPPKDDEENKIDYYFLNKEQFIELNNRGLLLDCGMYGGHYYGTMKPYSSPDILTMLDKANTHDKFSVQSFNANHPAVGQQQSSQSQMSHSNMSSSLGMPIDNGKSNLYENHESLKMHQAMNQSNQLFNAVAHNQSLPPVPSTNGAIQPIDLNSEPLPLGWERVVDPKHGTYYIDHNTQRTQYERPYEIELTKSSKGFGFTLVEADNGLLLVRSIIEGGPAYANALLRPGDILLSAMGFSVAGMSHTDVAILFSTFAVGDRVRLTFARSHYVVDENVVPDEYIISGTNGDLQIAVNANSYNYLNHTMNPTQNIYVDQQFDLINVKIKRGDQGFGFTINNSSSGQKIGQIHKHEQCNDLRKGDTLISLDGQDLTRLTHEEVVERLKCCPPNQEVTLVVKRRKRFRSKTPMAMHTENGNFYNENTPRRNCKTPSVDAMMLRKPMTNQSNLGHVNWDPYNRHGPEAPQTLNRSEINHFYNPNPVTIADNADVADNMTVASTHISNHSMQPTKFTSADVLNQMNQYNNFMNNDRLVMMQMQQSRPTHLPPQPPAQQLNNQPQIMPITNNYSVDNLNPYPVYSNNEMVKLEYKQSTIPPPPPPVKPSLSQYLSAAQYSGANLQHSYYANNEEIAQMRSMHDNSGYLDPANLDTISMSAPIPAMMPAEAPRIDTQNYSEDTQPYEYHQIELDRKDSDSNWGIRLIGGAEVDRGISIGSIVSGGAASKNGELKSGDEIISINGQNVTGATHTHVVNLISSCSHRASLVVRRKKFADACEVVLTRNMNEGFGFVIISSGNFTLIGHIMKGSPADRCQQLHVKDRIIAVNGHDITPNLDHAYIVNMIKKCGSVLRLRIIPADCYTVELIKNAQNDNFGFSMRGGSEYDGLPLYILRVAPDGLARESLNVGDQIIEINNIPTLGMTHQQAATIIKYSDTIVKLKLRRSEETPPSLLVDSPRALQKLNQVSAEMKPVQLMDCN